MKKWKTRYYFVRLQMQNSDLQYTKKKFFRESILKAEDRIYKIL